MPHFTIGSNAPFIFPKAAIFHLAVLANIADRVYEKYAIWKLTNWADSKADVNGAFNCKERPPTCVGCLVCEKLRQRLNFKFDGEIAHKHVFGSTIGDCFPVCIDPAVDVEIELRAMCTLIEKIGKIFDAEVHTQA